jgi:hypothetical protein
MNGSPLSENDLSESDPLLDRRGQIEYANKLGFTISPSWLEKLCLEGKGPPVDCIWGKRKLSKRSTVREWVRTRGWKPANAAQDKVA